MSLEKFSNRIVYLMECEEISKRALSARTNVQRKSIINWVSGKFYPRYDSMVKIADFFNVSTDYLLGIDEECLVDKFKKHELEDIPKIFLINLNKRLSEKKMSYYKLAKEIGIGQSTISKWIKQNSMPETAVIIKIATLFNDSIDFLLGRED